jgi:sec-independent protein translocase protein TatC
MAKSLLNRGGHLEKAEMSFIDHLEALRWHIIRSVIAILVFAVVIFIYRDWIFDNIIAGPINPDFISYSALCDFSHFIHAGDVLCLKSIHIEMQTTTYGGQFLSSITIALVGGVIAAFPYIFWEFWRFIKPALKPKELKNTRFIIFFLF